MSDKESDGEEQAARSVAIEEAYVHQVYEECAENTLQTRHWPRIYRFLNELEPGALVCDIGCGNGKYLSVNHSVFKIGVDRCKRFTDIAREKENEVLICDNLALPFRDESFDAVLSIAVVHHFATTERRVHALKELARVLRIGGKLVISVWAMEQRHQKFESQDVLVPWPKSCCSNEKSKRSDERCQTPRKSFSKRNSQRKCSNRSQWIDPIFSPSTSTSSLSSPNETCYSFFRRALQKLAGSRRGSSGRPWFLENWQNGTIKSRKHQDIDESYEDVAELPIELRRVEENNSNDKRNKMNERNGEKHCDSFGIKSKSLGDILEFQRQDLVRSRSSIPGLCYGLFDSSPKPEEKPTIGIKGKLVKQKSCVEDDDFGDNENTAIREFVKDLPEFQVASNRTSKRGNVLKQSSMNEELMSQERLEEKERVKRNIMKQASLNEEIICKRRTFEAFKDSIYAGNAGKRLQSFKSGLTDRIKRSTTNIEKVSSISIKNGFVRILQGWKTEDPDAKIKSAEKVPPPQVPNTPKKEETSERRSSKEEGSDSSKDSSLQSDTSVDSEDSFASVIYIPKKQETNGNSIEYRLSSSTSAPPSPRVKQPAEVNVPRLKLISPLLKQFPATSKSLPPPSPPFLGKSEKPFTNTSPEVEDVTPLISGVTETKEEEEENRRVRLNQIKELLKQKPGFATRTKPCFPLVRRASTATATGKLETVTRVLPRLLSLELFNPETDDLDSDSSGVSSPESVGSVISVISDERYSKKDNEKTGGSEEVIEQHQETTGESASSSQSSKLLEAAANVASSLEETVETVINRSKEVDYKSLPPVETTWNEECRKHLIDFTEKLSENLINDIDFYRENPKQYLEQEQQKQQQEQQEQQQQQHQRRRQRLQQQQQQEHSEETDSGIMDFVMVSKTGEFMETNDSCSMSSLEDGSQVSLLGSATPNEKREKLESLNEDGKNVDLSELSSSQESLPSDRQGGAIIYHQYCHVFKEGELDQLIDKYVENLHIISSYYDHASWCIVAEKVQVWTI